MFVHNLGLELVMWTLGIVVVSGKLQGATKRLINGPSVAIVCGLFLNFSGWHTRIPVPIVHTLEDLGACAIPISLLLVGISLAGVLLKENWKFDWRVSTGALVTRFAAMPMIVALTAMFVARFLEFDALSKVLMIEAAMPAAIFPIVISKHFGGKPAIAAQIAIVTSIASLALTPVLLSVGLGFLEQLMPGG